MHVSASPRSEPRPTTSTCDGPSHIVLRRVCNLYGWSHRRVWLVAQAGDYTTPTFKHFCDGASAELRSQRRGIRVDARDAKQLARAANLIALGRGAREADGDLSGEIL